MKTRGQFSAYQSSAETSQGMALMQDLTYAIGRIQITARYALFDTDNFDNRQYSYERDVWLAYSLPAYSGEGIRNYIMLYYKLNKHITFWIRYGRTRYTNQTTIGSGVDGLNASTTNDVKVQIRFVL